MAEPQEKTVYLSLGSNLGNRKKMIEEAITALEELSMSPLQISKYYETAPWGFESKHPFLNCVVRTRTVQDPLKYLNECQKIEQKIGRSKKTVSSYEDRIIDIDIIDFGGIVLKTKALTLPHAKMAERLFVLIPLKDLNPTYQNNDLNQSINQLIEACKDEGSVKLVPY